VAGENFRDADCEKGSHGDEGERDQKDTRHELDRFVGLFLFFLRFIHMPINAQPNSNGSPSFGGSRIVLAWPWHT
jgi:hypothetical protein